MMRVKYSDCPYEISVITRGQGLVSVEAFDWLEEYVSEYNDHWTYTGHAVRFKHEQDAMMFGLRWAEHF